MNQHSELLRRLRQLPAARRDELFGRLESVSPGGKSGPLSFRQEQLWLFDRVAPSAAAYGLGFALSFSGPLDVPTLERAIDDVAAQHELLRSVFPHDQATGQQQLRPWRRVNLQTEMHEGGSRDQLRQDVVRAELQGGFDISNEPVLRFRILQYGKDDYDLIILTHALVMDWRSAQIFASDLADAYRSRASGDGGRTLAPQFGAYTRWQREWVQSAHAASAIDFWRGQLSGWEPTELLSDKPRPRLLNLTNRSIHRQISRSVTADLQTVATRLNVPPSDVLLAGFAALLSRVNASRDLVVGMPHAVPNEFDVEGMIGDTGNLLPLRINLDAMGEGMPFLDLIMHVNRVRLDAITHGDVPFKRILDELGVEPDASRLPLVQIGFTSVDSKEEVLQAGALRMRLDSVDTGTGSFELSLESDLEGSAPWIGFRYATSLHSRDRVEKLLDRYLNLLPLWLADPSRCPEDFQLATETELRTVLNAWNAPIGQHRPETIHDLFAQAVARVPNTVAVSDSTGVSTYSELDVASIRIAHALIHFGVGVGDLVPVAVERGRGGVAAILGVLRAGAAYVPIDLGQPADRITKIIEDCGAQVAIASTGRGEELLRDKVSILSLGNVLGTYLGDVDEPEVCDIILPAISPAEAAYVIYTSGSTGIPKGVVVEHRNVTNFVRTVQRMFLLTSNDRFLQYASNAFDVSIFEIFAALLSGATLYVTNDNERHSAEELDRLLSHLRITVVDIPPAILELLSPENYPELRVAFVGGESFSGELTTRWARQVEFHNGYGPTETTVTVVDKLCTGQWQSSPPIGRAMENHRAYVLDERMRVQPTGAVGQLAISGLGVARGYLNQSGLTASRFRPDPYGPPGSRMYLTGDLASWNTDGDLVFRGRIDRQVKIRGVRIELGDVEAALQSVDGVSRAIADVVIHPQRGSLLVGYVVPESGRRIQVDAVRASVVNQVPSAMVPNVLVPLAEVPLTRNGKTDRRALPAVEFDELEQFSDTVDCEGTATEHAVRREVFAPLLGSTVANTANFFAAGGTSLQAIRISTLVKATFGVEVPIASFFSDPTVTGLASLIDAAKALAEDRDTIVAEALALVEGRSDQEINALADALEKKYS